MVLLMICHTTAYCIIYSTLYIRHYTISFYYIYHYSYHSIRLHLAPKLRTQLLHFSLVSGRFLRLQGPIHQGSLWLFQLKPLVEPCSCHQVNSYLCRARSKLQKTVFWCVCRAQATSRVVSIIVPLHIIVLPLLGVVCRGLEMW